MRWFGLIAVLLAIGPVMALEFTPGAAYDAQSGADGVWSVANREPSRFCEATFKTDVPYTPDGVLLFDYRTVIPDGVKVGYVAINLYDQAGRSCFVGFEVTPEWKSRRIAFDTLVNHKKEDFVAGDRFVRLVIYTRIPDSSPAGKVRLELRNVRFETDPDYDPLAGVRTHYAARPLFDWGPQQGAASYRLEYSPSKAYPADRTTRVETTRTFAQAPEAPPAGILYYRVYALPREALFVEGRLWLPERRQEWALPAWDFTAFAALPRPRLLEAARETFATPEAARTGGRGLLDFVLPPDPKPFQEGADPAIPAWIDWYKKVADGVIADTGFKMQTLGKAAAVSGDTALVAKAKELALGVARQWDPNGGSFIGNCDLQASTLLLGLGFCADAAWTAMTPEEQAAVAAAIRGRGVQFYFRFAPFQGQEAQNHAWDSALAAGFAGLCLADTAEGRDWFEMSMLFYAYRFFPALGFDGENNEGLAYWAYGLSLALKYVDLVKALTDVDFYLHPYLHKTTRFPMYTALPDGYASPLGDSGSPNHSGIGPVDRMFTARIAGANGDGAALWYAGFPTHQGVNAVFPGRLPASFYYPHLGAVFFNTNLLDGREAVTVGFRSGPYFAGHQHADQNHFYINAYGDKLVVDGGYYDWWGSEHFYGYSLQTRAHNTVLVDGQGQQALKTGADGRIARCFDGFGFGFVKGDAAARKVYNGKLTRFDRSLLFVKPDFVVVRDELAAPQAAKFTFLLHSQSAAPIALTGEGSFGFDRPGARLRGRVLLPENAEVEVKTANTIIPAVGYSTTPVHRVEPEWLLTANHANPELATDFLVALALGRGTGAEPDAAFEALTSTTATGLRHPRLAVLFNRTPGSAATLGELATDGECAVVRLDESGAVADALLIDGTFVTFRGLAVLPAAVRGDRTLRSAAVPEPEVAAAAVTVDGTAQPDFRRWNYPQPEGGTLQVLEGRLTIPRTGRYRLPEAAHRINFVLANAALRMAGDTGDGTVFLTAGNYLATLISRASIPGFALTFDQGPLLAAELLPADWTIPPGAVVAEAEDPAWESAPAVQPIPDATASGTFTSGNWFFQGKRGEWRLTVPRTGRYQLVLRLATARGDVIRGIAVDGRSSSAGYGAVSLPSTGGSRSFRDMAVPGEFELTAGEHRLQLQVIASHADVDVFILVPKL